MRLRYTIRRSDNIPPAGLQPDPSVKQKKQRNSRWCRFRRAVFPWLERAERPGRISVPPTTHRPDGLDGRSMDARGWEIVQQHNFPGPLGRYYAPDDPHKPEVYMFTILNGNHGLAPIPQYQHRYDDGHNPPPYEWARLSSLPAPVVVDDSWSSLHAAQREKSRLLETQSYLSSRIAEIDRKVRAVMDTKQERDPDLPDHYMGAQVSGVLRAVGLPDHGGRIIRDVQAGRPVDRSEVDWLCDVYKMFELRERFSPVSLLSPPPSYY